MPDSDKSKKIKEDTRIKRIRGDSYGIFKDRVKEVINNPDKGVTLFVGNGLSRILGYPSWDELANNMLKELARHKVIGYDDESLLSKLPTKIKMSIADSYLKDKTLLKENKDKITYQSILLKNRKENSNNPYEKLIEFTSFDIVKRFITTNYDTELYQTLKDLISNEAQDSNSNEEPLIEDRKPFSVYYDATKDLDYPPNKKFLLYLHGSIDNEDTIIASIEGYLNLYTKLISTGNEPKILKDQTVIFIGYGLDELEILELLMRQKRPERGKDNFLLLPYFSYENEVVVNLEKQWDMLKIKIIPYLVDNGHEQVNDEIENLIKIISSIERPTRVSQLDEMDKLIKSFEK